VPAAPPKNRNCDGSPRALALPHRMHLRLGGGWSLAAIALIWAAVFLHLFEQREVALGAARGNADGLARGYEESLTRGLSEIDQTLLYVRALHARDGVALDLEPWVNSAELASRAVLQISMTDRNGLVTLSDLHRPTKPIDLSDRPYFRHFANAASGRTDDDMFIGTPTPGPASNRWSLQFARALTTAQGGFDGIVTVAVDPDTLIRLYRTADVGRRGVVTLTGLDGIVRARADGTTAAGAGPPVGQRSVSPAVARTAAEAEGGFEWLDPSDGERRIDSFRRVAGYPLLVEVALATNEVLRGLRTDLIAALAVGLAVSVTVGIALRPEPTVPGCCRRTHGNVTAAEQAGAAMPSVLPPGANSIAVEPTMPRPLPADHLAVEHLTDTLGSDAVAGIVANFLDGLPRQLGRMRDLARAGDTDPLLREAHALAGSAATIGLDELGAAASELEQDLKCRRLTATAARLDRIDRLARSGLDRLAAYLHKRAA